MNVNTHSASTKGTERKRAVIEAAAAILRESGPGAVTHRAVARRARCSLSATTYYFEGIADLLHQAGRANMARWASRAERAAEQAEAAPGHLSDDALVELLLEACVPQDENLQAHYSQLISSGNSALVSSAYRTGRSRLNAAVIRILNCREVPLSADLVIGVVDGASVSALSEGRDVYATIRELLTALLQATNPQP